MSGTSAGKRRRIVRGVPSVIASLELAMRRTDVARVESEPACADRTPALAKPLPAEKRRRHGSGGHDQDRRRRLDLRSLARLVLSGEAPPEAGAGVCEPAAHLDRDQRHLLWVAKAPELRQVARRDARRLRL